MEVSESFIPEKEAEQYQWLIRQIGHVVDNANTFGWDTVQDANKRTFTIPASTKMNVLIGRWPIGMQIKFDSVGTSTANACVNSEPKTMSSSPVTLTSGATTLVSVNALGGAGKYYLNIENTSNTDPAQIIVSMPPAGWYIVSCSLILERMENVNSLRDLLDAAYDSRDIIRKSELNFVRSKITELKASPLMTHDLMVAMEIAPKYKTVDDDSLPVAKVSKVPQGYKFAFSRKRAFKGVNLYRQRPGETDPNIRKE